MWGGQRAEEGCAPSTALKSCKAQERLLSSQPPWGRDRAPCAGLGLTPPAESVPHTDWEPLVGGHACDLVEPGLRVETASQDVEGTDHSLTRGLIPHCLLFTSLNPQERRGQAGSLGQEGTHFVSPTIQAPLASNSLQLSWGFYPTLPRASGKALSL